LLKQLAAGHTPIVANPKALVAWLKSKVASELPGWASSRVMAVVSISSTEGGWPEAGLLDRKIRHVVPAMNQEDIVSGENRANWRAMVAFCVITLMKVLLSNDFRPTCVARGKP
jgi:hypothetical protein